MHQAHRQITPRDATPAAAASAKSSFSLSSHNTRDHHQLSLSTHLIRAALQQSSIINFRPTHATMRGLIAAAAWETEAGARRASHIGIPRPMMRREGARFSKRGFIILAN